MTDLHAAVLGVVQGLTEFLPISSTAHIELVDKLVFRQDSGTAFTAIIQWGTVLASVLYFRKDILNVLFGKNIAGASRSQEEYGENIPPPALADRRLLIPIIIGTIPIVIAGLALKKLIANEFRSLYVIGGSLIVFAVLLAIAEKMYRPRKQMGSITIMDGLMVGLAQMFAVVPGASRSGTSLTGALFTGLERSTAARFSFLLSLPAVFGAGLYEFWKSRHDLAAAGGARPLVIATILSFVVGYAAIDWLIKFLRKRPTYVFIVYRIAAGILLLSLLATGKIKDTTKGPIEAGKDVAVRHTSHRT